MPLMSNGLAHLWTLPYYTLHNPICSFWSVFPSPFFPFPASLPFSGNGTTISLKCLACSSHSAQLSATVPCSCHVVKRGPSRPPISVGNCQSSWPNASNPTPFNRLNAASASAGCRNSLGFPLSTPPYPFV